MIRLSADDRPDRLDRQDKRHVANVHVQPGAAALRQPSGPILRAMPFRYQDPLGRWTGGFVASDGLAQRNASLMFS